MTNVPIKISALPAGTTPTGTEVGAFVQGGITVKLTTAQISQGLSITRLQIPTHTIVSATFTVTGYSTAGDLGNGAVYTSQGANGASLDAVQDAGGTWFRLIPDTYISVGWFGAKGDGSTDDTTAFVNAYAACTTSTYEMFLPPGTFRVNSLVWDQLVNVRGSGSHITTFIPTGNGQTVITIVGVTPTRRNQIVEIGHFATDAPSTSGNTGVHFKLSNNCHYRDISAQNMDVGIDIEGGQNNVFDFLVATNNNIVGVRLTDDRTGVNGGGNNNQFNSLSSNNAQVGLMVGRTGLPFPMGNNNFINPNIQVNSLCGAFFIDQVSTFVSTCHPEGNATGVPNSAVILGETITKSSFQCVSADLLLAAFEGSDSSVPILAQSGSSLTFSESQGINVTSDLSSIVTYQGSVGNNSQLTNVLLDLSVNATDTVNVVALGTNLPASMVVDQSFPNTFPNPVAPTATSFNCFDVSFDADPDLGLVSTATFNNVIGSLGTNRVIYTSADSDYPIASNIYLSFLVKPSITGLFHFSCAQTVLDYGPVSLQSGVWTRVFMKNLNFTGLTRSALLFVWPEDTHAATLSLCRFVCAVNPNSIQVRQLSHEHRFNPRNRNGVQNLGSAVPTFGTWAHGDIIWNNNVTSGGFIGWVCTVAGSPGTWKTWGAIS